MTLAELNDNFALSGVLAFETHGELTRARITLPACEATVYLHGAHITHWQPSGQHPVLFLSPTSEFAPGKAIRGGIPVCFPWFGSDTENRAGGKPGPSHGFARTQDWELAFAALAGQQLHLTFTLAPSDLSRSYGCDGFRIAYEMTFGTNLTLRLSVANLGAEPFPFEEALHAYYGVGDVREATLAGLEGATFLDKTDDTQAKTGPLDPLTLVAETDRVYPENTATAVITDQRQKRTITIVKDNSATTIVWNPFDLLAAKLADLPDDAWPEFLCVETANTGSDKITLAPGQAHTMQAVVAVDTIM